MFYHIIKKIINVQKYNEANIVNSAYVDSTVFKKHFFIQFN